MTTSAHPAWYTESKDRTNAKRREWYARNKERVAAQKRARKLKQENLPT